MLRVELGRLGLVEVVRVVKLMAAVRSPWFQSVSVEVCGGGGGGGWWCACGSMCVALVLVAVCVGVVRKRTYHSTLATGR